MDYASRLMFVYLPLSILNDELIVSVRLIFFPVFQMTNGIRKT